VGFPEAGTEHYRSQPAPKEDDTAGIGWDESGMIPEEAISTAEGHEDPDAQPITMDVTTDSPQPMSPKPAAALDEAVLVTIQNDGWATDSVPVDLGDMTASKQAMPPTPRSRKSRPRKRVPRQREDTWTVELASTTLPTTTVSIPAVSPPSTSRGSEMRLPKGRGILRLKAPPKVGRDTTSEHQPPPVADLALPQWAIHVPPPPIVEYRAATPLSSMGDSQLFASQPEPSQMQNLDEDYRPLVGTWGDIVEQEERAASAAAAVSAALATLPDPVAISSATAREIPAPPVISTVPAVTVTVAPMPMASLLLRGSTAVASTTTVSATVTGPTAGVSSLTAEGVSGVAVASATDVSVGSDTRRLLNDQDITYAVRLVPAPDAAVTMDALMTSFRTTMTRKQLLHIIQLVFDVQRDTSVFLTERITVARLTDQSSDEILDEILGLLRRFTIGTRLQ